MNTVRLLAIGNSLAENPLTYLADIAASTGEVRFVVGHATLGGCSLVRHWRLAEYTAEHPEHKTYQLDLGGGAVSGRTVHLRGALVAEPWDLVTLNQASIAGPDRSSFQPWLGLLHGLVRQLAPQAGILLNQTWAYREDSPYLIDKGLTCDGMFERLKSNYAYYARQLGCRIIPTGEAIQQFRRSRPFTFPDRDYDFFHPRPPALPRQDNSLSVGWYWAINETPDGLPQLVLDFNHLNPLGLYLAGLTWYGTLTGLDPRQVTFVPRAVEAEDGAFLRDLAHEVCTRYRQSEG